MPCKARLTKFLGLKIIWKQRKDSRSRKTKLLRQNSLTLVKWPKFPNIFQNSLTWRKFDFSLTRGNPGHNVYLQLFLGTSKLDIFTGTAITQTSILKIKYFWYTLLNSMLHFDEDSLQTYDSTRCAYIHLSLQIY